MYLQEQKQQPPQGVAQPLPLPSAEPIPEIIPQIIDGINGHGNLVEEKDGKQRGHGHGQGQKQGSERALNGDEENDAEEFGDQRKKKVLRTGKLSPVTVIV